MLDDRCSHSLRDYGSLGKFFHLKEFSKELEKQNVEVRLVHDIEFSKGFPSKNISDWIGGDKKFKELIESFQPDAIFTDRQTHFGIHSIKSGIPTFVLLRGHYWQEYFWGMKTLGHSLKTRLLLWLRNKISEEVFQNATAILPICKYLEDVVKKRYPMQNTGVFLEGINSERWYHTKKMELKHPCVGLVQDANWWGKTKELLVLEKVLEKMPDVHFYWAGDGQYKTKILEVLEKFENFHYLGFLDYPDEVRKYLTEIDIYALPTGMDTTPLSCRESMSMKKPIIGTNVGGIPEMIYHQKTGLLVDEGDSQAWIKSIELLLSLIHI